MSIDKTPLPLPVDLTDSTSLILVIEPIEDREAQFKMTYHYWSRDGQKESLVSLPKDTMRMVDELNTRLLDSGDQTKPTKINLHRTG